VREQGGVRPARQADAGLAAARGRRRRGTRLVAGPGPHQMGGGAARPPRPERSAAESGLEGRAAARGRSADGRVAAESRHRWAGGDRRLQEARHVAGAEKIGGGGGGGGWRRAVLFV